MQTSSWSAYLYRDHPERVLRSWATSLAYFRFCRAYGGHANDGDRLLASLVVESEADLQSVFLTMGIPVARTSEIEVRSLIAESTDDPKYLPRFPIGSIPGYLQPSHTRVAGAPVHLWIENGLAQVTITDERAIYEVTEEAVANAKLVERVLAPLVERVVDPPQDNKYCICPKHYPEFWRESA